MILSGLRINEEVQRGNISIDPYDRKRINPNSYNLRLHEDILLYRDKHLDMRSNNNTMRLSIPSDGLLLHPNTIYLARTIERTSTDKYVPMLEGRSSIGRLGIFIHATAGFGDVGFCGHWTLEISVVQPVRIYAGVEICQIYYHTIDGDYEKYAIDAKYNHNNDVQSSQMWRELGT